MGKYVDEADIVLGEMDAPRTMTVAKAVKIGEESIDAVVGQIYRLPLTLNEGDPAQVGDVMLLRKINRFIAIGTCVTAGTSYAEGDALWEYGAWHLRQAEAALKQIAAGAVVLNSQPRLDSDDPQFPGGPIGSQRDAFSLTDDFYATRAGQQFSTRPTLPAYPGLYRDRA